MLPRLSHNGMWYIQTVEQFQKGLTIDFGHANKKRTARRYNESLVQRDKSFLDFLSTLPRSYRPRWVP